METITNAANAASRAIFGENTTTSSNQTAEEPISGELGDTSKGEPYDAGNADSTETETTKPETNTTAPTTDLPVREKPNTSNMPSTEPTAVSDPPVNTASTNPIQAEKDHDKTGVIDAPNPSSAVTSDKPSSSNEPTASGAEASVSADPSSGAQNTQKQQGAERPEEEPSSEEHKGIQEAKKEAEEAQGVDVSGPGPVPLDELKKSGGGAPTSGGDDDDGPQKESHGEGTGEKYVKSSGLKADGGDFDAANPGAGKEADRLLEEKGVHHTTPGEPAPESESNEDVSGGKKPSLKEKIKAKLHKH